MDYARDKHGVRMSRKEAERYRRRFFATYRGLKAWHDRERRALKRGDTETRTLAGRRRTGIGSFNERVNSPVQGSCADGLKLALALLYERRHECPGAVPVAVVHDGIVVECDEGGAEKVKVWLEKAMLEGMDEVINAPGGGGPTVPIGVAVEGGRTWAG